MIYKKYFAPLFLILLLSLSFVACAENNSLQKKYGAESFYFLGLQSLEKKDIDKAEFYFHKAGKKSSSLIAEKSSVSVSGAKVITLIISAYSLTNSASGFKIYLGS